MPLCRHSVGTYQETSLTRNSSGTTQPVVLASWATVEWSWPKEWNKCARANLHLKKKKAQARNELSNIFPKSSQARKRLPPPLYSDLKVHTDKEKENSGIHGPELQATRQAGICMYLVQTTSHLHTTDTVYLGYIPRLLYLLKQHAPFWGKCVSKGWNGFLCVVHVNDVYMITSRYAFFGTKKHV